MRVKREFDELHKDKRTSALQFEAAWGKSLSELEKVGLGKTRLEKYLSYLEKIGPHLSEKVRQSRELRDDGTGVMTLREPQTWEEAHSVVVEQEGIQAGTRAFSHQMRGGATDRVGTAGGNSLPKSKKEQTAMLKYFKQQGFQVEAALS